MEAITRADCYQLLAGCMLKTPNACFFQSLAGLSQRLLQQIEANTELYGLLTQLNELQTWPQEYEELFHYPVSWRYIPPFESCVLEGSQQQDRFCFGPMNGQSTQKIEEIYALFQFKPSKLKVFDPFKQPPLVDHLGYELAFMSYLCFEESILGDMKEFAITWQDYFLHSHLEPFVKRMAELVIDSKSQFYCCVFAVMQSLISQDLARKQQS